MSPETYFPREKQQETRETPKYKSQQQQFTNKIAKIFLVVSVAMWFSSCSVHEKLHGERPFVANEIIIQWTESDGGNNKTINDTSSNTDEIRIYHIEELEKSLSASKRQMKVIEHLIKMVADYNLYTIGSSPDGRRVFDTWWYFSRMRIECGIRENFNLLNEDQKRVVITYMIRELWYRMALFEFDYPHEPFLDTHAWMSWPNDIRNEIYQTCIEHIILVNDNHWWRPGRVCRAKETNWPQLNRISQELSNRCKDHTDFKENAIKTVNFEIENGIDE